MKEDDENQNLRNAIFTESSRRGLLGNSASGDRYTRKPIALGGALHLNSILHQNYNVSAGPGVSDALTAAGMMPAGVWL
jgi:hypothetical protein